MRKQIDILFAELKGTPAELLQQTEEAIKLGAEFYECISGKIYFYRLQDEEEYLNELEKKFGITMRGIKRRLKEIRQQHGKIDE